MLGIVINVIIVTIVNIVIIAIILIIVVIVITIVSIFFEIVIILNSSRKPFPGRHIWFGLLVVGTGDFWYFVNAFFRFGGWCSCGCR